MRSYLLSGQRDVDHGGFVIAQSFALESDDNVAAEPGFCLLLGREGLLRTALRGAECQYGRDDDRSHVG
jgi:hypothetical protein